MKSIQDLIKLSNEVEIPCMGYGTWRTPAGDDTVTAVKAPLNVAFVI